MKRIAFLAGSALLAAAAYASPNVSPEIVPVSANSEIGTYVINLDGSIVDSNPAPRTIVERFDNWRAAAQGGVSNLIALYNNGASEIADDLTMVAGGSGPLGGLLDTMGMSVANVNAPAGVGLQTGQGIIRFYGGTTGALLGGFGFNLPTFASPGLLPNGSSRISFAAGALRSLNILIPDGSVYVSTQWTSATYYLPGGSIANLGIQLRDPINTGTSSDNMYNANGATIGTSFNFDGQNPDPLANNAYFLKTDDVPEPASLVLLALGGLALIRRR